MPSVSTTSLLAAMVLLTALALAGAILERTLRRRQLRRLAHEAGWELEPSGPPELLLAIVRNPPVPGAADVRVMDVVRQAGAARLSIARVDYTLGCVRQRRDSTRILAIVHGADGEVTTLQTAPADLPQMDQYRHLVQLLQSTR